LVRLISRREATASSWRTCPKVKVRRNVPNVEGARIPSNSRSIAPCRNSAMSSIESAPAIIPAISAGTFSAGLAPPALRIWTWSAARSCNPARSASSRTGARPAHDTRLGSSKTAV